MLQSLFQVEVDGLNWQVILQAVIDHVTRHETIYLGALSAVGIAGVCTMPALIPKSIQEWWTWIRDTLQTAVPAARAARTEAHSTSTTTTPTTSNTKEATVSTAVDPSQATTKEE